MLTGRPYPERSRFATSPTWQEVLNAMQDNDVAGIEINGEAVTLIHRGAG
jgi:hypothetical protein